MAIYSIWESRFAGTDAAEGRAVTCLLYTSDAADE